MDDQGNPIFSQEGTVDLDSLVSQLFADNRELKSIVSDKMEALMDSIKIDTKEISKSVMDGFTKLFTFSEAYKKDLQKSIKTKIEKMLDSLVIDKKTIDKNITSLFEYKDKDKQLKSVFDKINDAVANQLSDIKGKSKSKAGGKESDIVLAHIVHIDPNALKAVIMDTNILDVDSGILKIISDVLSDDQVKKTKEFLEPHLITLTNLLSPQQGPQPQGEGDTVFENEPQPVKLMDIAPNLMAKLKIMVGEGDKGKGRKGEEEDEEVNKSGGILGFLGGLLGLKGLTRGGSGLFGLTMTLLKSMLKLPSAALRFATNPLTLLIGGLIWGIFDGVKAALKADEWGVSKTGAFLGGFIAGGDGIGGFIKNMGKWAMIGAGVGMVGGPIGMIIGGLVGGILGGIFNAIGVEKMAKAFDAMGAWFQETFGGFIDKIKDTWGSIVDEFKTVWMDVTFWFNEKLMPSIQKFKSDLEPIVARISSFISEILIPDLKRFFGFLSPVFDAIKYAVTDIIWPIVKQIGAWIGEGLVGIFNNLGPFIEGMMDGMGMIYDGIVKEMELIGKGLSWLGDKLKAVGGWFKKLWGGSEEEQQTKELEKIEKEKNDRFKEKMELQEKLAFAEKKNDEKAIKKRKQQIKDLEEEQKAMDAREVELQRLKRERELKAQGFVDYNPSAEDLANAQLIPGVPLGGLPVQDLITQYRNPRSAQFQLDGKDKLETVGDTNVYSKQGGTLDKAIGEMKKVLEKQLVYLNGMALALDKYLVQVANNTFAINEAIPQLNMGQKEAPIPAEQSIPEGYIRDPIYEYRMKIRELMV